MAHEFAPTLPKNLRLMGCITWCRVQRCGVRVQGWKLNVALHGDWELLYTKLLYKVAGVWRGVTASRCTSSVA